ncbi:unnamed protein product [Darwinula stevensoni]|uniref:Lipase domain-containing protein n=1 Tax=Darwinula stevensoni TaxID=69355 RepID=A0A7R9A8E0_9CRUS|nr:unnamed protein product [Darwinula stevensoni]CAG0896331.1 unnamed protein product [Darwinula stevensoni]
MLCCASLRDAASTQTPFSTQLPSAMELFFHHPAALNHGVASHHTAPILHRVPLHREDAAGMLINLADLLVRSLMIMGSFKWERYADEIKPLDDVLQPDWSNSSRGYRALDEGVGRGDSGGSEREEFEFSSLSGGLSVSCRVRVEEMEEMLSPLWLLLDCMPVEVFPNPRGFPPVAPGGHPARILPLHPPESYRVPRTHLRTNETRRLEESPFDSRQPVVLLTHGFLEHGRKAWLLDITRELLKLKDLNVIVLSWLGGSGPPYTQAAANTRLVGVMAAHFLAFLAREAGTRMEEVHVVGHSLGSHLASYIGSSVKDMGLGKLGRITGLDPAQVHFEDADPRVRLDPEDALFVDVIHTDAAPVAAGGWGILQPLGHVDFYPNSGARMPGCESSLPEVVSVSDSVTDGLIRFLVCNHVRAIDYFTESINSQCPFLAHQCSDWVEFTQGGCVSCGQKGEKCGRMGYHAREAWKPDFYEEESRQLYLFTGHRHPFCGVTHVVTLVVADHQASRKHGGDLGAFYITLQGSRGSSSRLRLGDEELFFEPGQKFSFLVPSTEFGEVDEILVEWEHGVKVMNPLTWRFLSKPKTFIDRVVVKTLERNATVGFCGRGRELVSGEGMTMKRDDRDKCL